MGLGHRITAQTAIECILIHDKTIVKSNKIGTRVQPVTSEGLFIRVQTPDKNKSKLLTFKH